MQAPAEARRTKMLDVRTSSNCHLITAALSGVAMLLRIAMAAMVTMIPVGNAKAALVKARTAATSRSAATTTTAESADSAGGRSQPEPQQHRRGSTARTATTC
jgi:hypothetical protein